jgi:hypothetical protein
MHRATHSSTQGAKSEGKSSRKTRISHWKELVHNLRSS